MAEESKNDWGAYSAGNLIDKTLYNIRRERRCEFIDEGLRTMDLYRWRAMDQMIESPYHIEGFKIWGPMQSWFDSNSLKYNLGDKSTVSSPDKSVYLRVYEKTPTSLVFNGHRWNIAHYLSPIALQHFLITSEGNDVETSPIYQNPGWPIQDRNRLFAKEKKNTAPSPREYAFQHQRHSFRKIFLKKIAKTFEV